MRHIMVLVVLIAGCGKGVDDYMKKSKNSEAKLQLMKLQSHAKSSFAVNATFIKGSAPLTPSTPCCAQPTKKCKGHAPGDWDSPVWQQLEFQLDDDFYFQYSYESDGTTLTARAVGDPGCDGNLVTFELKGSVANGNPSFTVQEPQ
jgi:hypothetical protein